jgi:hypothetical protein
LIDYPSAQAARDRVAGLALAEVGKSDPTPYWGCCRVSKPYPPAWCGAFALSMLIRTGLCDWPWRIGVGFLYRLRIVKTPKDGDIAYYTRSQHHAVFVGDGLVVNGNGKGGKVTLSKIGNPAAIYSLDRLVLRFDEPEIPEFPTPPTVRLGSVGETVRILQTELQGLVVDGDFGPKTLAAVVAFQGSNALEPDGVVGPKTWGILLSEDP